MAFLYLRPLSSPGHYFIRSMCVHSEGQTDSIELVHNLASPGPRGSKWALPLFLFSPLAPIHFLPSLPLPFPKENDQHRVLEERAKDGEKD